MDYDKYLIDSQETYDGVNDLTDDELDSKEQAEQESAEDKWERMHE